MKDETREEIENLLTYITKADKSRACTFIKLEAERILKELNSQTRQEIIDEIRQSKEEFKNGDTLTHDEVWNKPKDKSN